MGAVDEGFGQIDLAANTQVLGQGLEDLHEGPLLDPLLHSAMTGLIGRIFAGQRLPGGPSPQDPKNAVEHTASWHPGPTLAVATTLDRWDQWFNHCPLLGGELHLHV
jgi:hypothetical protein